MEYAQLLKANPSRCKEKIKTPDVVGAIIDLGHCLNLLDAKSIQVVKEAYEPYVEAIDDAGWTLPENQDPDGTGDLY